MKIGIAYPDRVIVELDSTEIDNIKSALLMYHRDQQNMQTPFGCRIQQLASEMRQASSEMWAQDARARGLTVEGDEPHEAGAF